MNKSLKNLQLSDQNASWTFQLLRLRLKSFFSPSLFFSSTGSIRNKRVSISEIQQHIKLLIRLNSSDFLSTINATKKLTRSLQPRRKMLRWIQFQIFCGKFYGFKFYKNALRSVKVKLALPIKLEILVVISPSSHFHFGCQLKASRQEYKSQRSPHVEYIKSIYMMQ